ncbi:MAG: hypothetical protein QUS14_05110 [Pyrinomonadaceae bacterium]|nr:hypothetical protein [Pyrinomonadaceae bacterium]
MSQQEDNENEKPDLKDRISGLGQKIIGEIETIGGVLTADPITQAEGEFNLEVGELREEIEEDLENSKAPDSEETDAK